MKLILNGVVSAPSNIALIKYMGKIDSKVNLPANPSLSFALENYRTYVRISEDPTATKDSWRSLEGLEPMELSEKGQEKFLKHFARIKELYGVQKYYLVQSANNFASDAGLASSASSFAALTMAAAEVFEVENPLNLSVEKLSEISRQGSGSSCRSFFYPWAKWDEKGASTQVSSWNEILHDVILISSARKEVSSSEAHLRVLQSPQFQGRVERATKRYFELQNLLADVSDENWKKMFTLVWDEFEDMHQLFESCPQPFTYRNELVFTELKFLKEFWEIKGTGPLVTMDAGPNIHLLFRKDEISVYRDYKNWRQNKGLNS